MENGRSLRVAARFDVPRDSMDHRVKPGGDDEKNGDLVIASGSEAIQGGLLSVWIASSLRSSQ
jgi:hypothetical protein